MNNKTKILVYDIENSPLTSYTWGLYDQNVIDIKTEWYMLSFAYKWLGGRATKVRSLYDYKGYNKNRKDDKRLLEDLWRLLDEADVVIGHNVSRFDNRKANARFLAHGMSSPSPYKVIDTCTIARKYFHLTSNKLNNVAKLLGVGRKEETGGFQLWLDCMDGKAGAWKKMKKYNKRDVEITEKVYLALRPWMTSHPNVNILDEKTNACPKCGSTKIQKRGWSITPVSKKRRYQCQSCYGWSAGKPERVEGIEIR